MIDVDGQAAQDYVRVDLTGVAGTDYIVRVHDTGDAGDGADVLTINGTDAADTFLIRAELRRRRDSPAFVARMQPSAPRRAATSPPPTSASTTTARSTSCASTAAAATTASTPTTPRRS